MYKYKIAATSEEYAVAAELFREYAGWLNIDLSFQDFKNELAILPVMYAKENGGIILCRSGDGFIGCVGVRRISGTEAEMKRMWVRRGNEGTGIGRALLEKAIQLAADTGYKKIKLDTLNDMLPAMNLYKKYGFREIPAYYNNPDERAIYFEKEL
ncbi:MAG: GNAT family N-acetyltransferase [Ferruginibacter sp.]